LGETAPYKNVLTHGFVVDETGRKMSKSQGNILKPETLAQEKGADILRLWVVSSDCEGDLRIGSELLRRVEDLYRRLRNTFRYLLGALGDFKQADRVAYAHMPELEKWVYHQLFVLGNTLRDSYEAIHFQPLIQQVHYFCANDLSAFYLDVRKDALYCDPLSSSLRRAAQTVMADVLDVLVRGLAPILAFTCEEVWQTMQEELGAVFPDLPPSVHQASFRSTEKDWQQETLAATYTEIRAIRQVITGGLERARAEKKIGSSLEAHPVVYMSQPLPHGLSPQALAVLSITSDLSLSSDAPPKAGFSLDEVPGVVVDIQKAQGYKCERCWKVMDEVLAGPDQGAPALCIRCTQVLQAIPRVVEG
jgi:isoleucyl-tRNA synthetase